MLLVKVVKDSKFMLVVLLVCGDYELNEVKVEKLLYVVSLLIFVIEEEICVVINVGSGFFGLVNMLILVIIDCIVVVMSDFVVGVNIDGKYYFGINWDCDVVMFVVVDICNVVVGDLSLDGQGMLFIKCGIEVGYIFQLGIKYLEVLKVFVQGEDGCNQILIMGCYGIGVICVVVVVIEQNFDECGIVWFDVIVFFQVVILLMNMYKFFCVQELVEKLYSELCVQGIEVLMDDCKECLGVMFVDMELIGILYIIVIGDCNLDNDDIEYKYCCSGKKLLIKIGDIVDYLVKVIKG